MAARHCLYCLCSRPACPPPAQPHCRAAGCHSLDELLRHSWGLASAWTPCLVSRSHCHPHRVLPVPSLLPISGCLRGSHLSRSAGVGFAARISPTGPSAAAERSNNERGAWLLPSSVHPSGTRTHGGLFRHSAWGFADSCLPVSSAASCMGSILSREREGKAEPRSKGGCSALKTSPAAGSEWAGGRGKHARV